jgi:hypothetical protein
VIFVILSIFLFFQATLPRIDAEFVPELELVDAVVGLHDNFHQESGNKNPQLTSDDTADNNTSPPHHQSMIPVVDASESDRHLTSYSSNTVSPPATVSSSNSVLPTANTFTTSPANPKIGDNLGA